MPGKWTAFIGPALGRYLGHPLRTLNDAAIFFFWTHFFWNRCFHAGYTFGPSMLPTFNITGDWVIVSNFHSRGRGIGVGDIVSYVRPVDAPTDVLKRVVGMPGDFVVVDPTQASGEMVQVPKGHVWVAGDNLPWSFDSRHYGPVPLALIRGKCVARVWPQPKLLRNPLQEQSETHS